MRRSVLMFVWLMVMTLAAQLSAVAAAAPHDINRPVSTGSDKTASVHGALHNSVAMQGRLQDDMAGCETGESDCDEQSDCRLEHCSIPHGLAVAFHQFSPNAIGDIWPRVAARTFVIPLPPPGQPPKTA